jgi:hypothetical protein
MIDLGDKEALIREMHRAGLIEPGIKQRWRLTARGNLLGAALYGIRMSMDARGEPNPDPTESMRVH